ncbi:DNA repair protein RecN [bacterium]|nr:DNA repair protein RecN [bacterium]
MLRELSIKNFAIIESERIFFESGFNVLTGETGAGKSIVIGALSQLLGGKANTSLVRSGDKRAVIEAIFEFPDSFPLWQTLAEMGIERDESNQIILRKEIVLSGRNRSYINDVSVTTNSMTQLLKQILSVHGQHQQQVLLDSRNHLAMLDRYGQLWGMRTDLAEIHLALTRSLQEIAALKEQARERSQRLDLINFQIREIDQANLVEGEEEDLLREQKVLTSAHQLLEVLGRSYEYLSESDEALLTHLAVIGRDLEAIAQIDDLFQPTCAAFNTALYQLQDVAEAVRARRDQIEVDPVRLETVGQRLEEIRRLKRKYGDSIGSILAFRQTIVQERDDTVQFDTKIERLSGEVEKKAAQFCKIGHELSHKRKHAAEDLSTTIVQQLRQLGMESVHFAVQFRETEQDTFSLDLPLIVSAEGFEEAEFLISPNVGEEMKPLAQIASGGEISRIMLGFRTLIADLDQVPTLVFDEVDVGIGGNIARAVGQKIKEISSVRQIICITHLPQIASLADHHLLVSKEVQEGRTFSRIRVLNAQERVGEIARMLDGESFSELSKDHAASLLCIKDEQG